MPTGTLTKKIHCHETRSVRTPPSSRPAAAPPAAIALHTPSARVRSALSVNVVVMIDSAAGETSAPPRPCRPRPTISIVEDCASPFNSDASENSATPATNSRLRPSRSAGAPAEHQEAAEDQRVGVDDPRRLRAEKCSPRWIDGSATFTIVASSTTMNWARQTITSTSQRLSWPRRLRPGLRTAVRGVLLRPWVGSASDSMELDWSVRLGYAQIRTGRSAYVTRSITAHDARRSGLGPLPNPLRSRAFGTKRRETKHSADRRAEQKGIEYV